MDASKVTIKPETFEYYNQKMAPRQRIEEQNKRIIELIKKKPYGKPISLLEFAAAIHVTISTAYKRIEDLVNLGKISKDPINDGKPGKPRHTYRVNGIVKITQPASANSEPNPLQLAQVSQEQTPQEPVATDTKPEPETKQTESDTGSDKVLDIPEANFVPEDASYLAEQIIDLAKDFYWETQGDTNLRDFIEWVSKRN